MYTYSARLLNTRSDSDELIPHIAILKSLCLFIPLIKPDTKAKYEYLNRTGSKLSNNGNLVKNDALYADISDLVSVLEPMAAPTTILTTSPTTTTTQPDSNVLSFDELRLAEEINMEDQVCIIVLHYSTTL
jgi:hypothetical protein